MAACREEWLELLSACFDGECTAEERARLDAHIETCAPCAGTWEDFGGLRASLRAFSTPDVPERVTARARMLLMPRRSRRGAIAAIAAAALAFSTTGLYSWIVPSALASDLVGDLETHHLRSFSRATPCEFESQDPEKVEAWLREHLGYDVKVELIEGATLLGARRCRLHGQLTAAIRSRVGDMPLTVFVPPESSKAAVNGVDFAAKGPRCTVGTLGDRICVDRVAGVRFAVSELDESKLLSVLDSTTR